MIDLYKARIANPRQRGDVHKDEALGRLCYPRGGCTRNNFMDYCTPARQLNRTMFFRNQIETIMNNLNIAPQ